MDAQNSIVLLGFGGPAWRLVTLGFGAGAEAPTVPPTPSGIRAERITVAMIRAERYVPVSEEP